MMKKKPLREFRHTPDKLKGPEYSFLALSGRSGVEFIAVPVNERILARFGRDLLSLEARMSLFADALDSEERGLKDEAALESLEQDISSYRTERTERRRADS